MRCICYMLVYGCMVICSFVWCAGVYGRAVLACGCMCVVVCLYAYMLVRAYIDI